MRRRLLIALAAAMLAAPALAGDWTRSRPEEAGLAPSVLEAMAAEIGAGKFGPVGSVVIARHGKLAYEGYFAGDAATLRDTRSATKSVTGVLVGLAIQRHLLKGDARILSLLPQRAKKMANPDPRKSAITVEDLLTMSSPLECDDWNDASRGNEERMYLVEDWAQFILDLPVRGRMHLGENPPPPDYGRYFSYCTGGVFVLSEVLGRATGKRTDRFADEALFGPLDITKREWVYSPLGVPQTGGGLRLASADLLKIAQLYLDNGRWQGRPIVDPAWVAASIAPHSRIDDKTTYGYLWWLKTFQAGDRSFPAFYMSGNGGNKVVAIPSLDLTAVITSTNFNTRGMHDLTETILTRYVIGAAVEMDAQR